MSSSNVKVAQLLFAATATGTGAVFSTQVHSVFTFSVVATGVTTGCTMRFEGQTAHGDWVPVNGAGGSAEAGTLTISANGNYAVSLSATYQAVRANILTYTDGTYNAWVDVRLAPLGSR